MLSPQRFPRRVARSRPARDGASRAAAIALLVGLAAIACRRPQEQAAPRTVVLDLTAATPEAAAADAPPARAIAEGTAYLVPFGARLDFLIAVPAQAVVTCDAVRALGPPGGVELVLEEDGAPAHRLGEWRAGEACAPIRIGAARDAARLSMRSAPRAGGGPPGTSGGVVLERPRIEAPAVAARAKESRPPPPRNVLVYLVDTLRADRLGCYGGAGGLSPKLDAFASGAAVFERAVAQTPWTRASVATLFTGQQPPTHGVQDRRDALAAESTTMAELLAERGFATAGFVASPNVSRHTKMHQGFKEYVLPTRRENEAAQVGQRVLEWLERRDAARPFLLYVHTVDPHSPYLPRPGFRERFAPAVADPRIGTRPYLHAMYRGRGAEPSAAVQPLLALYAGEVAQNDAAFGVLLDGLDRLGLASDTAIVFVSDHGEEFYEHGHWEHGKTLYREVLDVPLVMRIPGWGSGARVATPVGQVDVLPTLLDALGMPIPAAIEGRSLLPLLADEPPKSAIPVPAYAYLDLDGLRSESVELGGWKLIRRLDAEGAAQDLLFERASDPLEARDRAAEAPIRTAYLRGLLAHRTAAAPIAAGEVEAIDPETEAQLRALGYID